MTMNPALETGSNRFLTFNSFFCIHVVFDGSMLCTAFPESGSNGQFNITDDTNDSKEKRKEKVYTQILY